MGNPHSSLQWDNDSPNQPQAINGWVYHHETDEAQYHPMLSAQKDNAKAIFMIVGKSATLSKPCKAKSNVSGCIGIHSKQLTHDYFTFAQ